MKFIVIINFFSKMIPRYSVVARPGGFRGVTSPPSPIIAKFLSFFLFRWSKNKNTGGICRLSSKKYRLKRQNKQPKICFFYKHTTVDKKFLHPPFHSTVCNERGYLCEQSVRYPNDTEFTHCFTR
jgi:hypothetical protein